MFWDWFRSLPPPQRQRLAEVRERQTLHDRPPPPDGAAAGPEFDDASPRWRTSPPPLSAVDPSAFMGLIRFHDNALPSLPAMSLRLSFVVVQVNAVCLTKRLLQLTRPGINSAGNQHRPADLEVLIVVNLSLSLIVASLKVCFGIADGCGSGCGRSREGGRCASRNGGGEAGVGTSGQGPTGSREDGPADNGDGDDTASPVGVAAAPAFASSDPGSPPVVSDGGGSKRKAGSQFLGSFIMLSVYLALTPVLLTLTEPYADDMVANLVGLFLALHLLSHDYFPRVRCVRACVVCVRAVCVCVCVCVRVCACVVWVGG